MHIPMTLADFTSEAVLPFRRQFSLNEFEKTTPGLCACSLGIWDPHVQYPRDRQAYRDLFKHVDFLAISGPLDELEHVDVVQHIATSEGLAQAEKSQKFNCSTELR